MKCELGNIANIISNRAVCIKYRGIFLVSCCFSDQVRPVENKWSYWNLVTHDAKFNCFWPTSLFGNIPFLYDSSLGVTSVVANRRYTTITSSTIVGLSRSVLSRQPQSRILCPTVLVYWFWTMQRGWGITK